MKKNKYKEIILIFSSILLIFLLLFYIYKLNRTEQLFISIQKEIMRDAKSYTERVALSLHSLLEEPNKENLKELLSFVDVAADHITYFNMFDPENRNNWDVISNTMFTQIKYGLLKIQSSYHKNGMLSEEDMSHLKKIEEVMHSVNDALPDPGSWFDQQKIEDAVKKCNMLQAEKWMF